MVKNVQGGSKHKKMASKNTKAKSQHLVVSREKSEIYAIIVKKLGGGHLSAKGIDGKMYMVHIGGKFRNERINCYDFILIGLRDWATSVVSDKATKSDLLEVYNENEKVRLIKSVKNNWNMLLLEDNSSFSKIQENNEIEFTNEINESESLTNEIQKCTNSKKEEDILDFDIDLDFI